MTTMTNNDHHYIARYPKARKHNISGLFVFLLIAAYAMFSLLLVLIGVQAYQNTVDISEVNQQVRTSMNYLSGRVRSGEGKIEVRAMDGHQVLVLSDAYGEPDYETRIYFLPEEDSASGGGLYEQIVGVDEPFDPELGELISTMGRFDMSQDKDMILMELVTSDGETSQMHLRLNQAQFLGPSETGGDQAS